MADTDDAEDLSAEVARPGQEWVREGGGADTTDVTATLALTGDGTPELAAPVDATVTSASSDFTASTVGWIAGDTGSAKTINVTATDDNLVEQTL